MPLSFQKPRQRLHRRTLSFDGFRREDGLWQIEALLVDTKDRDYPISSGVRQAGVPVHEMCLSIIFDEQFMVLAAKGGLEHVPYHGDCEGIAPAYQKLVGLNLMKGFRKTVAERLGGVQGCTHLTELAQALPTAALQTVATEHHDADDTHGMPYQLDRCHALERSSNVVLRYYPRWHRGRQTG